MTDRGESKPSGHRSLSDNYPEELIKKLDNLLEDAESRHNLLELAELMLRGRQITFITGAGLSVASGITPYRYSKEAIWSNFVVDWGKRKRFKKDPAAWWNEFWLRTHEKPEFLTAKPNPGHLAITELCRRCHMNVVTQNIDLLHAKAGLSPDQLVEVHGSLGKYKCVNTTCVFSKERSVTIDSLDEFSIDDTSMAAGNLRVSVPRCPGCIAPLMPQALMFDEKYKSHEFYRYKQVERWLMESRALVFVGTSMSVGVTHDSIEIGRRYSKSMFTFNIYKDEDQPGLKHIVGDASKLLPFLVELIRLRMTGKGTRAEGRPSRPRLYCYKPGLTDPRPVKRARSPYMVRRCRQKEKEKEKDGTSSTTPDE